MITVFIGNGKMAIECYKILSETIKTPELVLVSPSEDSKGSSFRNFLKEQNISYIETENPNEDAVIDKLNMIQPEVIFTINSYKVLRSEFISSAKAGVINFHNSILPDYRGVNIPFWVIWNEENSHGITWHYINEKIDSGKIIHQEKFELRPKETYASIMLKCVKAGITSFGEVLNKVINNGQTGEEVKGEGRYYSRKMLPENEGLIDFTKDFEEISKLVRGLNIIPFKNEFCYAHLFIGNKKVIANRVKQKEGAIEEPGKVISKSNRLIEVQCKDSIVVISDFMGEDLQPIELEG